MELLISDISIIIFNYLDLKNQLRFRSVSATFQIKYQITNMPNMKILTNEILLQYPNLTQLYASGNDKIKDINHLTKLQILNAGYNCGIDDKGISLLSNLTELCVNGNEKIKDLNHLPKLQILYAGGSCGIDDKGISCLTNLTQLNADDNEKIKDINHLTKLQILNAGWNCEIDDKGISRLTNLTQLDARNNKKITRKI